MLTGALVGILVPAGTGWDFANFYDTGRRAAAGQLADIYDPTKSIAAQAPQGRMAFWGAPISAWLYAPLSLFPPLTALLLFKLAGTLAYFTGLALLFRRLRFETEAEAAPQARFAALFTLAALVYQPLWTMYRVGGQSTPFVFLLLVLGLLAHERDRPLLTAVALTVAVLIKPAFLFVPALLVLLSGRRFLVAMAGSMAAAGLLSLAVAGWPLHREFIDILLKGSQKPSPWFFNSSLYILADAFRPIEGSAPIPGAGGRLPDLLRIGLKLGVLASFVWLAMEARRQTWAPERRRQFNFLLAVSYSLLLSQVVWEHYLAVLFLPLAALIAGTPAFRPAARRHLGVIFIAALAQNLILVMFFRSHVEITSLPELLLVSLIKSGTLLLYLLWLVVYRDQLFRWYAEA
jgi:hypothetical protein